MQQDAVDCASQAMEKFNIEKDIAAYIKKEFDKKYGPTWHAVVGRNFGSYVTHEVRMRNGYGWSRILWEGEGEGVGGILFMYPRYNHHKCLNPSPSDGEWKLLDATLSPTRLPPPPHPPSQTKNFIYFYLGQVAVLLFKSG